MEYVTFGKTGKRVSRLGYGGAVVGLKGYLADYDPDRAADREVVIKAIRAAYDLGVTYFDTAPSYGDGRGETIYGEALAGIDRQSIFVATKLTTHKEPGSARKSLEQSLKRLGMDYVDLIQFHGSSYTGEQAAAVLKPGGYLDELAELKRQGLARHIGFTTEDNNGPVFDFIADGRFDTMQICYNLFMQHSYDPNRPFGSILEADRQGMGIATMRATTSGMFMRWLKKVDPGNTRDYTRDLIQFVFSNPLVDVVLVGMRTEEEVRANVAICEDTAGRIDIMKDMFTYYI
ncbi:hypothetical protein FACS1894191_8250 [Clostridia bacterium]|nr:hypothetical protein FACS1894191_8250 [Clostridia bacterium]